MEKSIVQSCTTIKFMRSFGFRFREHDENTTCIKEENYLDCLEYLNQYCFKLHLEK